jgi:hypothetical protein
MAWTCLDVVKLCTHSSQGVSAAVVENGENWDILNAGTGSRTGSGSERRGGNRLAQQSPEWGQDFLPRRTHLVLRLSPIRLPIDN